MDLNTIFNLLALAVGGLVLFLLRNIHGTLNELRDKDDQLQAQISLQALTVANNYISKSDFKNFSDAIFNKLDRIESKLDGKEDKT